MRKRWVLATVAVVAVSATAATVMTRPADTDSAVATTPTKTATLAIRTIDQVDSHDGTIGYEGSRAISLPNKGVVTKTRAVGDVVERGGALVWIDNLPVTLLYGDLPQWRPFAADMSNGPDVKQLEQSLVDLGYAKGLALTVDEDFTSVTTTAVKRMQDALGVEEDGVVDLGEVVFLSGASRVTAVTTAVGEVVGQSVVEVSSTKRVVTVDLDPEDRSQVSSGQQVTVKLPDGKKTSGVIRSVSTVVDTSAGDDGTQTVKVVIDLNDGADVPFDQAPVTVDVRSELAKDVLSVPVSALLAQPGVGYVVERIDALGTTMVPVELGVFSNGFVHIKGDVKAGDKVAVAS